MSLGIAGVSSRHRVRRQPATPRVDLVESGHAVVKHGLAAWQTQYRRRAIAFDLVLGTVAAFGSAALRSVVFGAHPEKWMDGSHAARWIDTAASTWVLLVLLPLAWVLCLVRAGAYVPRYLGTGNEEYRAIGQALVMLLAVASVFSYAFKLELSRGFVLFALPSMLVLTLVSRRRLRRRLVSARRQGLSLQPTLVVGRLDSVADMIRQIQRDPASTGLRVVGACISGHDDSWVSHGTLEGVPIAGGPEDTLRAVDELGADVVAVSSDPDLAGASLRRLGWSLEYRDVDLLVSPGIVGVAGPRLSLRPANGLSMLHVERPLTGGLSFRFKSYVDRALAVLVVLAFSPALLAVAALIRLDSKGPALFRQVRIGTGGTPFTMYKFRTMVTDAEDRLAELRGKSEGNGMLFKMHNDPRVTRVGRVLRKYSLDELPQLLNVVLGHMSLVGPRPPLGSEVDAYEFDALRRLRVRPGMTGLWQVSGRSDLSWEDSLRLDLWYVDNWSPSMDLQIVSRTFRAVFNGSGAY